MTMKPNNTWFCRRVSIPK